MAHILFVVPRFHTNLFFATRALVQAGHRVSVLAVTASELEDHSILEPAVLGDTPDRAVVADLLARDRPDLLLLRNSGGLSKVVGREARRQGLRLLAYDLKPLTQCRSLRKRLSLWMQGRPYQRVTPVRGLDPQASLDAGAHYLPWPTAALPLPDGAARDMTARPVQVLCVGKLAQVRKNQDKLIAALVALGGGADVRLTLVGSTSRAISGADNAHFAALNAAAARHDWITIRSDLPFADMARLYAASHICVLPSVGEPLGIAPVEGMAYGTIPVISTQSGSAGYLTDGQDGMRVDMEQPGALRAALEPLVTSSARRAAMSAAARHTAETELSPERFVQRVEALLRG
ncbi:glycosyltransferase family 4 protein [Puniceibacterium sp. IMCC21224]|uniref:glycosyltransferase family 4 protein n=1 Tax=Puniceibacterium sp. IMCC21224 TaxID=1618204 RepID=UPI00064D8188|nr:glycosyltransferase family 4 protein [Puniceibacterium sp. IMCC21224]KMK68770.1 glycosyl transferase group 1 [Puniceibacterium sp. IMCC21224]